MNVVLNESEPIRTKFKIQTPLWTGDLDKKSSIIKESGIIGSLRWWTEVILRGFNSKGFYSCDPNSSNRCPNIGDQKKYCVSCHIFGATGRRRSFKLQCSGGESLFNNMINIKPRGRNRGWYYPGSGVVGDIELAFVPLDIKFDKHLVLLPLLIASKWGAIGAKTQLGYGVIDFTNILDVNISTFYQCIQKLALPNENKSRNENRSNTSHPPNFKEMFFSRIRFNTTSPNWWETCNGIIQWNNGRKRFRGLLNDPDLKSWVSEGFLPVAPSLKDWLRYQAGVQLLINSERNGRTFSWLYGFISGNNRQASKIHISGAYKIGENEWEFRVWGWIPDNPSSPLSNRDEFLNKLKGCLDGTSRNPWIDWDGILGSGIEDPRLSVWREFNSSRDTEDPNQGDYNTYIDSLIDRE
ncbi:MAG: type III-B CRISPR module RAMP protein Cmr1 [Promethearchaeota archaeon]